VQKCTMRLAPCAHRTSCVRGNVQTLYSIERIRGDPPDARCMQFSW
jgi:hypothetical protein